MDWEKTSAISESGEGSNEPAFWREAAEEALLKGHVEEALQKIDKALEYGNRTMDLLMKLELLCAAGEYEQCMVLTEENLGRFETDLTVRERKSRLDSVVRKVADWLLRTADGLYEAERYEECAIFSRQVLTQHAGFLKMKKHRELFEFAWRSSYDEAVRKLFEDGEYEVCMDAVDAALTLHRALTTLGQRGRLKKMRALSCFRLGRYGKGLLDYFTTPGVLATVVVLALFAYGVNVGMQFFRGQLALPKEVQATQDSKPALSPTASPTVATKQAIRRAEIKSLKLFEADGAIPPVGSRSYESQFSRQARTIFIEVHYKNYNYRFMDVTLPLIIRYYGPSGALLQEIASTTSPKKEYESAITSLGWRPEGGAAWQPGRHVVKVVLDGEAEEEAGFEIR